ncbi:MAG: hypothetical protein RIG77_15150 [Cyclobacteriaceae bacterium]
MTQEEIDRVRQLLTGMGLSDPSLQKELIDHVCCDVENYMAQGMGFEEAFEKTKNDIPKNQFRQIQKETMEVLNKKIRLTTVFTYLSFFMLVLATAFKLMRFPGAGHLLMASFVGLAITLLSGLVTHPLIRERGRGRVALFALSVSVILFLTSLCFQLLHLPGMSFLRGFSVISSILILSGYAVYSYLFPVKVERHLIMDYIRKESQGIEKSLIILFVFGTSLKLWQNDFISVVFFMMLFSFGSLFYFICTWQYYQMKHAESISKPGALVISIIAYAMIMLPSMVNYIDVPLRILLVWGAYTLVAATVAVYYFRHSSENLRVVLGFLSLLVAVLCGANLLMKSVWAGTAVGEFYLGMVYSPFVYVGLFIALILFFKKPAFRALVLMSLAMLVHTYHLPGI